MLVARTIQPFVIDLFKRYPVVTLTGPRQSGKTTLARSAFPDLPYVNLESPESRDLVRSDPKGFFGRFGAGVILDEIQRVPELASWIQVRVDERRENGLFLLTGSEQFRVSEAASQSLAGRTGIAQLLPLSVEEAGRFGRPLTALGLVYSGFYPRLHEQGLDPTQALGDYFETYVERDLRRLSAIRDLPTFERFVRLCAGRVGQLLNLSGLANDAGVSHTTAREWLGLLETSFIVFRLPPWHGNVSKRLVKAPKLYFHDPGLASFLLGIESEAQVFTHPLRGGLFENLIVVEALKHRFNGGRRPNLTFFRDSIGNEVDLLYEFGAGLIAIEIKAGETVVQDAFKGLEFIDTVLRRHRLRARILVHGGKETGEQRGIRLANAFNLAQTLGEIESA
jgi:hypothetical protein